MINNKTIEKTRKKRPRTKESVGIAFPFYMLEQIDKERENKEMSRSQYVISLLRKRYPKPNSDYNSDQEVDKQS